MILNRLTNSLTRQYNILHALTVNDYDDFIQHGTHPFAFSANANAEDTQTLEEAQWSPVSSGKLLGRRDVVLKILLLLHQCF